MNNEFYGGNTRVGILGGGQLGRMMIREAIDLDIHISVLDPSRSCSCATYANEFVEGSFNDYHTVRAFGANMDVITVEIEHVNTDALKDLRAEGKRVYPQPEILEMIRDKGLQKQFYADNGFPTSPFNLVHGKADIATFPIVQKARTGGYDGKGVVILKNVNDLDKAFDLPSVLEQPVNIDKEIAVLVARNPQGETAVYPVVEMVFDPQANLVDNLISPARISDKLKHEAENLALTLVEKLGYVGILAVEMFLDKQGHILINEIAPRPHNSGHHTLEACLTSQFEQHLRAICGLPLGSTKQFQPACMINLLGAEGHQGTVIYQGLDQALANEGVFVHLYGKKETKPFRKMGHITVLSSDVDSALRLGLELKHSVKVLAR